MKYSKNKKTTSTSSRKRIFFALLGTLLVIVGVFTYISFGQSADNTDGEFIESPAASDDFEANSDRDIGTPLEREGRSTDTSAENSNDTEQSDETTESNSSISSDSGNITVTSPANNATFRSGDSLTGTAQVNRVHYRLIDSVVGVLVQGSSTVVDGRFSAKFEFNHHGNEGRIDVFTVDDEGIESDYVLIDVTF